MSEELIRDFVATLSKRFMGTGATVGYGLHDSPLTGLEWRVKITSKEGSEEYYSIFQTSQGWQWLCLYYV